MTDAPEKRRFQFGPIAWMARNSIAANLLRFILLGGGIWSAKQNEHQQIGSD